MTSQDRISQMHAAQTVYNSKLLDIDDSFHTMQIGSTQAAYSRLPATHTWRSAIGGSRNWGCPCWGGSYQFGSFGGG